MAVIKGRLLNQVGCFVVFNRSLQLNAGIFCFGLHECWTVTGNSCHRISEKGPLTHKNDQALLHLVNFHECSFFCHITTGFPAKLTPEDLFKGTNYNEKWPGNVTYGQILRSTPFSVYIITGLTFHCRLTPGNVFIGADYKEKCKWTHYRKNELEMLHFARFVASCQEEQIYFCLHVQQKDLFI